VTRRIVSIWGLTLTLSLGVASARAQTKEQCIEAHALSQDLQRDSKLLAARINARLCSQQTCPAALRSECVAFLERIDGDMPTVAIRVVDAQGVDLTAVRVLVDGALLKDQLDGKPVEIDPGKYLFRVEPSGRAAMERDVVVVVGQRNQLVNVQLPPLQTAAAPAPVAAPPPPPPPLPLPSSDGVNGLAVAGWVFAGVGVVGLGMFAGFGTAGMSQRNDLDACKPTCSDDAVDPVRTKLVVADVSLAVGLVSAVTAGILLPIAYGDEGSAVGLRLNPGTAAIEGSF